MAHISSIVTSYLVGLLTSDTGINSVLQADECGGTIGCSIRSVSSQNAPIELLERSQQIQYPSIYVYCEKVSNTLRDKFTTFSGTTTQVVEIRCSQDRIEGIERQLDRYVDAACTILDSSRGSWQGGAFFAGGYEVVYAPVRHGGKNFIQIARLKFDVEVIR